MRFFEGQDIVAFISDKKIDFTPKGDPRHEGASPDFDAPLSMAQREYLVKECGRDIPHVFWRKQVHGDAVLVAKDSTSSSFGCPDADAYITCQKNLPIAIRTADCVPVFLFDPVKRAVGLVHAGWKGTHQEITYKTVVRMQEAFGSQPQDIQAVLGPSIQPCCYEVGEEFRQYFPEEIIERAGQLFVDVTKNNYKQLLRAGLKREHINNTGICTHCDSRYFSFRRDGDKAGRMISLMMLI